jgi:hypothetical protein
MFLNRRILNVEFRTEEVAPLPACRALAGRLVAIPAVALLRFEIRHYSVLRFKKHLQIPTNTSHYPSIRHFGTQNISILLIK